MLPILLVTLLSPTIRAACPHALQITEVLFDPSSQPTPSEYQWEYIELYNPTDSTIDLSGYVVWDDDQLNQLQALSKPNIPSGTIPPQSRAVLVNEVGAKQYNFAQAWGINPDVIISWVGSYPQLSNSGEPVFIYDSLQSAKMDNASGELACASLPASLPKPTTGVALASDCQGQWGKVDATSAMKDGYGNIGTPGSGPTCSETEEPLVITPGSWVQCEGTGIPISKVQGNSHYSEYAGDFVVVTGVVTATSSSGFFLQTPAGKDDREDATSEGIFVYTASKVDVAVGSVVQAGGIVTEYAPTEYALPLTEIKVQAQTGGFYTSCPDLYKGADVAAVDLSEGGRLPPNRYMYRPPNCQQVNVTQTCMQDTCTLNLNFGLDFWESLEGMLVRLPRPLLSGFSTYGVWVVGDEGKQASSRTTFGSARVQVEGPVAECDSNFNPEAIRLGTRVQGVGGSQVSLNKNVPVGSISKEEWVEGVLQYDQDAYQLNLLTPLTWQEREVWNPIANPPPQGSITIATYNTENFSSKDKTRAKEIGFQVGVQLRCPTLVNIIEAQDNDGPTNSTIVDADQTFKLLVDSVKAAASDCLYDYVQINPDDDLEGGEPGGNIRVGFLYNKNVVKVKEVAGGAGGPDDECLFDDVIGELRRNPCRLGTTSTDFDGTRSPLVVNWEISTCTGGSCAEADFITIGVHSSSKGGSSPLYGSLQPFTNAGSDKRAAQHRIIADFVRTVAGGGVGQVVALGDFNELAGFPALKVLDARYGGPLHDVAEELLPAEECGSYIFEANSQELDHVYVTRLEAVKQVQAVRFNSPLPKSQQTSDHDPMLVSMVVGEGLLGGHGGKDGGGEKAWV